MARFGMQKVYETVKPELVFEAGKATFTELGYEIYKMRPFAFLVESRHNCEEGQVLANIITSPFTKEFSLVVKSETASQETVDKIGKLIFETFEKKLEI